VTHDTTPEGVDLPYHSTKTRKNYLSIFGKVPIRRAYYWGQGADTGWCPLGAELNLPKQRFSYLLQEWGELLGVDSSFDRECSRATPSPDAGRSCGSPTRRAPATAPRGRRC